MEGHSVAPRIVNDVSYVSRINHESRFAWPAQHFGVSFVVAGAIFGDVAVSFCVAGAIFGDVGVSLFVAGAAFGEILVNSQSATCCIDMLYFSIQNALLRGGKVTSANGRVQFCNFMLGSCWDHARIVRHAT